MTCKFQSVLFLTDSQSALCIFSSAPSYLLPESLWYVLVPCLLPLEQYQFELPMGSRTRRSSPEMKKRIYLPKLVPLCPLMRSQAVSPPVNAKVRYCQYRNWRRHISHSQLNFGGSFFLAHTYAVSSPVFAAVVTVFFYLHIFTGSVGKRILIVVPVDTLYRTSIISSSTVVLLNPFANLSLAPLSLFSIYGPDLGVWPDCWVSAEFLRAPHPSEGVG